MGIIPGSMGTNAYVVRGKGNEESLMSASHGAGRLMSRKMAASKYSPSDIKRYLDKKGIKLISASVDEAPMAYKDIELVMSEQEELVEKIACFEPELVKMAK